jgi:hypothetical protein
MSGVNVTLKVLDAKNKRKFKAFSLKKIPILEEVFDLKDYLLAEHKEALEPAKDRGFKIGYYGARGVKFHIQSSKQLQEAYETVKKGWITLWADPHSALDRKRKSSETTSKQGKRLLTSNDSKGTYKQIPTFFASVQILCMDFNKVLGRKYY